MKIPKRFLIDGKIWTLKYVRHLEDSGEPCSGVTCTDSRVIEIEWYLPKDKKIWTFWHEYAHAWLYEARVTRNTGGIDGLIEEIICDAFADVMTSLDKVVRWKGK